MLGGPHSARYDQDLLKIIGLSNVKHLSTNTKLETDISNIHNEIIEPETAPTSPNELVYLFPYYILKTYMLSKS